MEIIGHILMIILYICYLLFMTLLLIAIAAITTAVGVGMGLVKGINHALEIYFGTLIEEIGDR
ncbi:MAG: hypothetical protein IKJ35_05525 [Clostridia bacterium]|nr:hypothetical protein [Clostridia bacterium]